MRLEEMRWLSFKRICRLVRKSGCCAGPVDFVQSYGMQCESENPFSGVTLGFFFSQKNSAKSVTNTVKDFTEILWL